MDENDPAGTATRFVEYIIRGGCTVLRPKIENPWIDLARQ